MFDTEHTHTHKLQKEGEWIYGFFSVYYSVISNTIESHSVLFSAVIQIIQSDIQAICIHKL